MAKLGLTKQNLFVRGAARFNDLVYLALSDRKLRKKDVAHTRLISIDGGEVANVGDLTWNSAGMCVVKSPKEKLVVISPGGHVFTFVAGASTEEAIAGARDLRGCATIDGLAFACGMHREVYCREGERKWVEMSAPSAGGKDVVGFEAIGGFSRSDLYAVGWQGEIWHFNGKAWTNCDSPVNLILSGIACLNDEVHACGQAGTIVRGNRNQWEVLETDGMTDDLWDICWFEGRLYVSSMTAVYELTGRQLIPVDFGRVIPDSCYRLTCAEGVLWSIGQESIFSFDGKSWKQWD